MEGKLNFPDLMSDEDIVRVLDELQYRLKTGERTLLRSALQKALAQVSADHGLDWDVHSFAKLPKDKYAGMADHEAAGWQPEKQATKVVDERFADECPVCGAKKKGMVQKRCNRCGKWVCESCCFPDDVVFWNLHQECFDKSGTAYHEPGSWCPGMDPAEECWGGQDGSGRWSYVVLTRQPSGMYLHERFDARTGDPMEMLTIGPMPLDGIRKFCQVQYGLKNWGPGKPSPGEISAVK